MARAIHACPLPLVCGVGHETDFTIADFVADARAPTPTAAAEMLCPDQNEWRALYQTFEARLTRRARDRLRDAAQRLDWLAARLVHPRNRIGLLQNRLAGLKQRLAQAWQGRLSLARERLLRLAQTLNALSPLATLERGYAIVQSADGAVVRDAAAARTGDRVTARLARGELECLVEKVRGN